MLKHYLKIGIRNFFKHKTSSLINALGLSLAVGCSLFVYVFIEFFVTIDQYHKNGANIFVINREARVDYGSQLYSGTANPLGSILKENLTNVEKVSRLAQTSAYVRYDDKVFEEQLRFVDPEFLEMFSFPLKWGVVNSLKEPNAIILSEKMSEKYFDDSNPIGEQLSLKFIINDQEVIQPFVIRGVAREFDRRSSFAFQFLINYQTQETLGLNELNSWNSNSRVTFVQLNDALNQGLVEESLVQFVPLENDANNELDIINYQLTSLFEASRIGQKVSGNIFTSPGKEGFIVLSILATIMMSLACINYMNIAVASAAYRLKEIGIRKVMGGVRKQLVMQFLVENVIICLLAIALGILWIQFLFLPGFQSLVPNPLALDFTDGTMWIYISILVCVSVVGGAGYPALYVSRFQPTAILKDTVKFGGKSIFRKVLLGFQYFFSFVAVIAAIVLLQNNNYQKTLDWGYNQSDVIAVEVKGRSVFEQLKQQVEQIPGVVRVSGSVDQIGRSFNEVNFKIGEELFTSKRVQVGPGYIETLELPIIAGRPFEENKVSDAQSIIVNELFVKEMGWTQAIGQAVEIGDENFHVIGVVRDFHFQPFWSKIGALMIQLAPEENFKYLSLQVNSGDLIEIGKQVEASWYGIFPNDPFEYYYQDSVFDNAFQDANMATGVITTAGIIAIFLAVIGLFGLSAIRIKSKMKEISIRKVLGGGWVHLGVVLNKEFLILLGLASLAGIPVAYMAVNALLATITDYPVPITYVPFLSALLMLTALSLLAVGGHIYKAVSSNPSDVLRME